MISRIGRFGWIGRPADPDARLLGRAARAVAAQTAAAVAAVVLAMAGGVLLVNEHQQQQQANQVSYQAWRTADDVQDPPASTWLIVDRLSGERQVTPGAPDEVADLDPATFPAGRTRIVRDGREFVVYTGPRKIGLVSAFYGLSGSEVEDRRLQVSLGVAALFGVLGAAGIGWLIGRRAVRPLGHALVLQRRFVADASHELRTPLSVLLLRAQLLRRHLEGTVPAERSTELDQLVSDTKALNEVVNDLLLSVELDHRPQRGERVDLAVLAGEVTESLRPLAVQRSVELSSGPTRGTASSSLASSSFESSSFEVNGAPAALRRAIVSLVDNAIAHTAAGGHVRVQLATTGDLVSLAVIDDGEGLDPRNAQRLVERFARGTSAGTSRRFGLGLALADEVARAHGGNLLVEGEPGAGASFTLRLPAAH